MTRSLIQSVACAIALSSLTVACNQNKEHAPEPSKEAAKPQAEPAEQTDRAKEESKDKHRAM